MTIYDNPAIKVSLPSAITPQNIMSGFAVSGIWPFERNIFVDIDFATSYVTDRPATQQENHQPDQNVASDAPIVENMLDTYRTPSPTTGPSAVIMPAQNVPTPELIMPFLKAPEKKTTSNRRKTISAV
ncbi:unnamed protein product [Parnassius apollo]|uniref:(apollo) hypothetical protein n=1 Tax=Parnassius apollo TaxID=110799 RepID=A0A8S3X4E9_PARAO|nr:unnamed protein product [Parnassius apollo]